MTHETTTVCGEQGPGYDRIRRQDDSAILLQVNGFTPEQLSPPSDR